LVGFEVRDGKIMTISVDSSVARNGLLIDHNLLEVNRLNVVGLKDKNIRTIIQEGGNVITVTIIPSFVYDHIVKK
jgi:syntenin-1